MFTRPFDKMTKLGSSSTPKFSESTLDLMNMETQKVDEDDLALSAAKEKERLMMMETQQQARAGPLCKGATRRRGNGGNRKASGRTNGIWKRRRKRRGRKGERG